MKATDILNCAALLKELGQLDADDQALADSANLRLAVDSTLVRYRPQAAKAAQYSITMQIDERRQTILAILKNQDVEVDVTPVPMSDSVLVDPLPMGLGNDRMPGGQQVSQ